MASRVEVLTLSSTPLPQVSYKEFDFGHLDFTFAVKEELKLYLMRLLGK